MQCIKGEMEIQNHRKH